MTHEVFKQRLAKIYEHYDPEASHEDADDLMVEVLVGLGFDLAIYKEHDNWYG